MLLMSPPSSRLRQSVTDADLVVPEEKRRNFARPQLSNRVCGEAMSRTEKKLPPTPPPRPTAYAPKQIADDCETPGQVLTSSPVVARSDRDKSMLLALHIEARAEIRYLLANTGTSAAPTVQQLVPSTTTPDGSIQTVTQVLFLSLDSLGLTQCRRSSSSA